jgi:hypothetical protein
VRKRRLPEGAARLFVVVLLMATPASACTALVSPNPGQTLTTVGMPVPPPAVSGEDDTVSVIWALADSFDVLANNKCVGRDSNRGMGDGARVQLRADNVEGSTWATASAFVDRRPPRTYVYLGKAMTEDDGVYCVVHAVFAPATPDPESLYSYKFVGADWRLGRVHVGTAPYGQLDRPGYGTADIEIQTCPDLFDPPEKDCWALSN